MPFLVFLIIMESAAVNIHVQILLEPVFTSLGSVPGSEIEGVIC